LTTKSIQIDGEVEVLLKNISILESLDKSFRYVLRRYNPINVAINPYKSMIFTIIMSSFLL